MKKVIQETPVATTSEPFQPPSAEEVVRQYNFSQSYDREIYPEGGIYHIRAMTPPERREWQELMNRTKIEYDAKGQMIRDGSGNPVRIPAVTEAECIAFVKKFIGEIERIEVSCKRINVKSPEFDLVLQHIGKSLEYEVEIDADGNVLKPSDKARPFTCPRCEMHVTGTKVARTEKRFANQEVWWWVANKAVSKLVKNNEAREAALGNL
jgi:hypothetical protein